MAGKKAVFIDFYPVFGDAAAEWDVKSCVATPGSGFRASSLPDVANLGKFFFGVQALDESRIQIVVSNFRVFTWERILNFRQLEDLLDQAGVTGQPTDYCEYLNKSLSGEVKIILTGLLTPHMSTSTIHAKLMVQMPKEMYRVAMPGVAITMNRLSGPPAQNAMINIYAALLREFREKKKEFSKEQLRCVDLTNNLLAEKMRIEELKKQNQDLKKQLHDSKKLNITTALVSTEHNMLYNFNSAKLQKTKHSSVNDTINIMTPLTPLAKDPDHVITGQPLSIVYQRKGR